MNNEHGSETTEEYSKDPSPTENVAPPLPLTESYIVSASPAGRHMVLAHKQKFVVLELNEREGEYCAVGQGSGCETDG